MKRRAGGVRSEVEIGLKSLSGVVALPFWRKAEVRETNLLQRRQSMSSLHPHRIGSPSSTTNQARSRVAKDARRVKVFVVVRMSPKKVGKAEAVTTSAQV